ncbi:MAG TPA: CHAT domain-containing protein [Flavobacteriaceae bacterium]|nr:CHAT domain-containing protein [Flavobacteriaceae bacterium]MCB9213885.1 CHAT domain-containing protein [Alteromonas sp.]HPF11130.1 CHAT domain-containing protein [Flavobacteriaceae bacterium]HQU21202.1 CHAT domain-containing protein [Flavobacteriaceae bacterium]HQU65674.1 CHAT domain-containing protein [Flavobacteriaceae bacterium]
MSGFKTYHFSLFFFFYFVAIAAFSQENSVKGIFQIERWIKADSIAEAQKLLDTKIAFFRSTKNYDSLVSYVELVGSFALSNNNKQKAYRKAELFVEELEESKNPVIISLALQTLGYICSEVQGNRAAYGIYSKALQIARNSNDPQKARQANIEYKLGYEAQNFGDFQLAKKHYLNAISLLNEWNSNDVTFYQQTYNALGGMMWMESKLDSTSYYFNKSLEALAKADETDFMNALFRPALIKMNLSVLKNALGENQQAIQLSKESIEGFDKFIEKSTDEFRVLSAKKHRATAIENLGSYYHTLGEFKKADAVITYANQEKKKFLLPTDRNMVISLIVLAQAKVGIRDFESARALLEEALKIIDENPGVEDYWKSGALSTLGGVYENLGNSEKAFHYYTEGNLSYKKALQGEYSKDYFDELINISNFYAQAGYPEKALEVAEEIYVAGKKSDFKNTLQDFYHTVNLAEVNFAIKDYDKAIQFAKEALAFSLKDTDNTLIVEYRKPKALYILAAAQYSKEESPTVEELSGLLETVEEGLQILETRKSTIKNYDDLSLFIEENNQLFELAKKIRLALYQRTQNESYLDEVLSLHESSMYNRIRSRLNLRNDTLRSKIPKKVVERERYLKNNLNKIVNEENKNAIESFFEVNNAWKSFIDTLQTQFPDYYKLHYATLEESVSNLQSSLNNQTTLVRYFFIEENLYALVMTHSQRKLFPIDGKEIEPLIAAVAAQEFDVKNMAPKLHQLYQRLWKPFEKEVNTPNVVILPDRELFNLSFEMLTPKPLKDFSEISTNSLLAKYNISYQFSLLVIKPKQKVLNTYDANYVAFAPEFSDEMKTEYRLTVRDSSALDNAYLKLLPQPFSVNVIKKFTQKFNGDSFLNERASKQLFQKLAGEHKIIHIGTHAESDNISPELSRLVFAKNATPENADDNYLHTYEIYNYDLSSNLAILTACETGKPSYQAGEGMISLAHAFNYAGSESILTSLWEIDEESSSNIIEHFYEYLSEGLPKDEALRRAKLDYIATAKGRTASPQYWAGLVLMGDTAPLQLESHSYFPYWIFGIVLLLLLIAYFTFRKKAPN